MHTHGTPIAIETRQRPEALDVPRVVHDRNEVPRENSFEALATRTVITTHHEDRNANARIAQLDGFFQQSHAQAWHPRTFQRSRNSRCTMPIRIGLEHAPDCWWFHVRCSE